MTQATRGRLCMVTHSYFPADPRVAREARRAHAAGYSVDVVALRGPREPRREQVDGVHVLRLPLQHRRGSGAAALFAEYAAFTVAATLVLLLRSFRKPYAVVHIHNPPDFLVLAALVPRLRGTRIILDVHDLSSDMFLMRFDREAAVKAAWILVALERAATAVADAVITVHEPYREELIKRGTKAGKVFVVMNSVDDALIPAPARDREAGPEHFTVVYHGSLTPHYGVELLLDAADRLRHEMPIRIEIYGGGDAVPRLREELQRRRLGDTVALMKPLPQSEILRRVQRASAGVVPNLPIRLNEFALSSKLFEYVALEIPVACADLPTLRRHFDDDELYFFAAGSGEALAVALRAIAEEPDRARARARAARTRYEQAYAWSEQGRRFVALLDRLAASRHR